MANIDPQQMEPSFFTSLVESLVHEHQAEYYDTLNKSTGNGESKVAGLLFAFA